MLTEFHFPSAHSTFVLPTFHYIDTAAAPLTLPPETSLFLPPRLRLKPFLTPPTSPVFITNKLNPTTKLTNLYTNSKASTYIYAEFNSEAKKKAIQYTDHAKWSYYLIKSVTLIVLALKMLTYSKCWVPFSNPFGNSYPSMTEHHLKLLKMNIHIEKNLLITLFTLIYPLNSKLKSIE